MGVKPANTSAEEQAMRAVIDPWGRARWGDDVRVIHELQLGRRRADMLWVCKSDLILGEIKGPRDHLGDGRLPAQIESFSFYVPEIWLFVCERWRDHREVRDVQSIANLAVVMDDGEIIVRPELRDRRQARRDELCCSRLIERLWSSEVLAVAKRNDIPIEYLPGKVYPVERIRGLIARLLTGQQVMREVCTELRARSLVGMASDRAVERGAKAG